MFSNNLNGTWEVSKCLISHKIRCLYKTPWKNSTQTIFQGGSPWEAMFSIAFFVVVLYCAQLFWSEHFPKSFSPFLCYSFCILVQFILASHPWFLWCVYAISIGILWEFNGIALMFQKYSMVCLKGCPWCFIWGSHEVSKGCLWELY